ncbi:MAG: hypothetical protein ABI166_09065 [Mucilaginibacter sp.]
MKDQTMDFTTGDNCMQEIVLIESRDYTDYPGAGFWLGVYPPLDEWKVSPSRSRMICPWSMAAELADNTTPADRRHNIMEALKNGLKTIRQYGLPARRIMFAEDYNTKLISVCVD